MEIELRAKISNAQLFKEKLNRLNGIAKKKENERQVDIYLKHKKDEERQSVIRIRKNYENNNAILTFKGSSPKKHDDIAWEDFDTPINNPDNLERLLVNNGYVYVCLIDKTRQSFDYKEFEINIDNVRDMGIFVEIEKMGKENEIEKIKEEILKLFENLGINSSDIIKKGYVQMMIEVSK